jgi:hypothetical protein
MPIAYRFMAGRQAVLQREHRAVDCELRMQRFLSKNICKFRRQSIHSQRLVVYMLLTGQMIKEEVLSYSMLAGFRNGVALWKVPRLRPFVLVTVTCGCIRLWSIGELFRQGKAKSTRSKPCPKWALYKDLVCISRRTDYASIK